LGEKFGRHGRDDKRHDTREQVQRTALVGDVAVLVAGMVMLSFAMIGVLVRVLVMQVRRHGFDIGLCIGKPGRDPRELRDEEEPDKPGDQPLHRPK
jgi:hypothetical protein